MNMTETNDSPYYSCCCISYCVYFLLFLLQFTQVYVFILLTSEQSPKMCSLLQWGWCEKKKQCFIYKETKQKYTFKRWILVNENKKYEEKEEKWKMSGIQHPWHLRERRIKKWTFLFTPLLFSFFFSFSVCTLFFVTALKASLFQKNWN